MEPYIELSKKTTILFSPELHRQLARLADQRKTSIGELVRSACEKQYGLVSTEGRVHAVKELGAMYLPVSDAGKMKKESMPEPDDLLP